ncbi:hypothetical protein SUGI_1184850 [Cryptomeria japonica]|uniref:F-box protein At3g44326 n=1 Tax=Cryptomeria japonica TaxID=3369 RepID=UPI00241492D5|nr:F-box protein At3g44326 [Cryptomeria japonica]GLJ55221.1 hypothetical protein SUGI_1184850 [Cryptomeria japonica]
MSLNGDLIREILDRVDGITLANAGCVSSDFWSIARQEGLWEEACCSVWPSTRDTQIKDLISSSLGGFKTFYADCFPVIEYGDDSRPKIEPNSLQVHDPIHSDFVWVVDVIYKNKPIYSNVVWGIPAADEFPDLFCNSQFRLDLINFNDIDFYADIDQNNEHELPTITMSVDKQEKDGKFLEQLMENLMLSWILINKKTGQAANLSSWRPLVGEIEWPSDEEFVIGFGSVLPAHNIYDFNAVQCKLMMKCRVSDDDHMSLKITELSMELEGMMGASVNGSKSLLILERALSCRKSKDHKQILESHQRYFKEKGNLIETNLKSGQSSLGTLLDCLCILSGFFACVSFGYFIFKESGLVF